MRNRITLTEARVRALPAAKDAQRDTYHDEKQPGLQLRVTPAGIKTFSVFRRVRGGGPERITIGRWPDMPVEKARTKAAEIVAQLAAAENPAEARRLTRAEMTLGDLFEAYIKDRAKAGKRSVDDLRALWELYIGALPARPRTKHGQERKKPAEAVDWSARRLSEITTPRIGQLHTRIVAAGKATTANRVLELIRAMFGYAMRQRIITDNPAVGITATPKVERHRFIEASELPRFLKSIDAESQPWRDYFTVLLYVGYRRAAVAAMQWADVDLKAGTWTVPGERAKNGELIVLPVTGPALRALKRRWRDREGDWVFPGNSKAGHLTQPKKAWRRVLDRAKISDLRLHDLRRTLGSWLLMSGASLPAIGRALGHKDPRSTHVYARMQADVVAGVVAQAHRAMKAAAKAPKLAPLTRKS